MLAPSYVLPLGGIETSDAAPALGPRRIRVERDLDVAADACTVVLAERGDVAVGDPLDLADAAGGGLAK